MDGGFREVEKCEAKYPGPQPGAERLGTKVESYDAGVKSIFSQIGLQEKEGRSFFVPQ